MGDQLKSMISQTASGLLGAVIAALVGVALPQPFRVFALLAAAIWLIAIYWMGRKPTRKDVREMIEYLDALHNHDPQLISDEDYYRRLNRQLVLDGLCSRQLGQRPPTIQPVAGEEERISDNDKVERAVILTALVRWSIVIVLPATHGIIWALSKAGTMPHILGTALASWPSFLLVIFVALVANYQNMRQLSAPTVGDFLTPLFVGGLFWGMGYLSVYIFHWTIPVRPFLLSVSTSLFGMSLAGYLPYRRSIEKNVRHKLETLTQFTGLTFYAAGMLGYAWIFVKPIDFASMQALFLACLVGLSGFAFAWLCGLQWDLILDVVVDSCGAAAQRGVLTDRVGTLVQEAHEVMVSIIGLVPATALFALVMGFCTLLVV